MPLNAQASQGTLHVVTRASLPSDRLHFGLTSDPGTGLDWMVASGVPWRYRYQYLAGGINTGGTPGDPCGANAGWQTWNSPAGQFVTSYISASTAHSYIPVFTYYEIVQSNPSAGSESAELTKISTTCTMQAYWADFTVLMQKVGASGAQVVVHVEPDFWGFMEQQNADPSAIPAVVASSGNADLAGLPNTVQGMGWAFLKLRDKYAPNAVLAIHASSWASNVDIATDHRTTVDPAAEADKVVAFLTKAGITGNPTGITPWDVIFNDVADHDAGWYGALTNDHWWDRNNVVFPNFTRWLAFMNRMHTTTGLPLIEWQVPVGNQYYRTMDNTDGHYQDNRTEYFLAHPDQLKAAGIIAVLFGAGNGGTSVDDAKGDGITNPPPINSWQCSGCNNHVSVWSDDDGGFLRTAVGAYYGATPCTAVTLSANPTSPRAAGTQVIWTGSATSCPNPRYRFWKSDPGAGWSIVQDYSAIATYTWNSPISGGNYRFEVDVRDATENTVYDVVANATYLLQGGGFSCTNAGISATPTSPAGTGTAVTMSGSSATCPNPRYRFWVRDPGSRWSMVQDYSAATTHSWPQTGRIGTYDLEVDVRDASETVAYDVVANTTYTVNGCTAAGLSANPTTAAHGTSIALTGTSTCPGTPTYKFWVRAPGGSWTVVQQYGATNTFTWTPATAGAYNLEVDVRDQNSTESYEKVSNLTYSVS